MLLPFAPCKFCQYRGLIPTHTMGNGLSNVRKQIVTKLVTLFLMVVTFSIASSNLANPEWNSYAQTRKKTARPRIDYSQFSHATHVTQKNLECKSCHTVPTKNWQEVRKADTAFEDVADFPEHKACLACHRQQFFARQRPAPVICSNCHVKVTPRDTTRFLFPSLGDVTESAARSRDAASEFIVNFPHDKHVDVVSFFPSKARPNFVNASWSPVVRAEQPKSCPVCHQLSDPQGNSDVEYLTTPPKDLGDKFWLKKGTFQTSPRSHTVCFTCHNKEAELPPLPTECQSCHSLKIASGPMRVDFDSKAAISMSGSNKLVLHAWSRRISSGAFRHEGGEHPNLSCLSCHNVPTMNTTDFKTLKVAVQSCGGAEGCHITKTADDGGALNYEMDQKKENTSFVCTKCHITFGNSPVPESHVKAVQAMKK